MNARGMVIESFEKRILKWYGHLLRMSEQPLPKRIIWLKSHETRKSGKVRSWNERIKQVMDELNTDNEHDLYSDTWRRLMRIHC